MKVIKSMRNRSCTCTLRPNPFVKWSEHLNALKTGMQKKCVMAERRQLTNDNDITTFAKWINAK